MSDSHKHPHPNSPAGGGGPGAFRPAGAAGVGAHRWAGLGSTREENGILNSRVPPEFAGRPGWGSQASLIAPSSGMRFVAGHKAVRFRIIVVYDAQTSNGTLYLVQAARGIQKTVLQGQVVVGGQGHVTPTGNFHASSWEKDHTSKRYGWMADTPWSKSFLGANAFGPFQLHIQELEERGIHIHGTMGPGFSSTTAISGIAVSETSHGCVRMSNLDITNLHHLVPHPKGMPIRITTNSDEAPQ